MLRRGRIQTLICASLIVILSGWHVTSFPVTDKEKPSTLTESLYDLQAIPTELSEVESDRSGGCDSVRFSEMHLAKDEDYFAEDKQFYGDLQSEKAVADLKELSDDQVSDKVWIYGFLYKLIKKNFPQTQGKIISFYLNGKAYQLLLFGGNPERTETGERIIEGDIVIPKYAEDHEELSHRKATINLLALWTRANVYYTLHYSLNPTARQMIKEAMEHWENMTCVKFIERTTQLWYVRFRGDRSGCWSSMGRNLLPLIGQDLSIGNQCEKRYVVVHEVGHALGLNHEQSRLDRDGHVRILWRNIEFGGRPQFWRGLDNPYGVQYDLTSIMHYHPMAFSSRMFLKNTVVSRNPHHQRLVGLRRNDVSFRDAKLVNSMYRCDARCPNRGQTLCENGGYLAPFRESNNGPCPCVCPPNTIGDRCETVIGDYYESPPCGGNITEETIIETPDYPMRNISEQSCSWWIKAPRRQEVEVEFEDFSFRPRHQKLYSSYYDRCVSERVEIRTTDIFMGEFFCGTDIAPGTKMQSTGGDFIIIIKADDSMEGRGLRAKVTFVSPP